VARVDFMDDGPVPRPFMAQQQTRAGAAAADANDGDAALAVAQRLTLKAQVTLAPSK
jgi:hypothetical protein